jgi:signal transduction histidine kinase
MQAGPTLQTMRSVLAQLRDDREAIPWSERRCVPGSLVPILEAKPSKAQEEAAHDLLEVLAQDPKWEVRKAVADAIRSVPDESFTKILAKLCDDENTFVRRAAENALERRRRTPSSANGVRRGIPSIAERLTVLERTHGPEAASAAREIGEMYYDQLVGATAHDARGILTPLASKLDRMIEQLKKGPFQPKRAKRSLRQMRERVELLSRLVDDMRSYSVPVPRNRRPQRLVEILAEAERIARDAVEDRGYEVEGIPVQMTIDADITIEVARDQVLLAFVNVIKNALESFPQGESHDGRVIHVASKFNDAGEVEVTVRDNGMGIGMDDLAQLCEFLPGSKTKKNEGTGFGLPIARRNIAAHGGSLTIDSREDQGTVVTITMPAEQGGGEA